MTRLIVTGSRDWTDETSVMREIVRAEPTVMIHGAAPHGADRICEEMATTWAALTGRDLQILRFPADWSAHGEKAGPIRSAIMCRDGQPQRGLAFGYLYKCRYCKMKMAGLRAVGQCDGRPHEAKCTGTGFTVRRLLLGTVPVRWVIRPESEPVDLREMPR